MTIIRIALAILLAGAGLALALPGALLCIAGLYLLPRGEFPEPETLARAVADWQRGREARDANAAPKFDFRGYQPADALKRPVPPGSGGVH